MKGIHLLEGISEIDEELIEEALESVTGKKKHAVGKWYLPGVAVISLIIGVVFGATIIHNRTDHISMPQESISQIVGESMSEEIVQERLPILSNERLVIWTEEKIIYVIDSNGQIEEMIEDAVLFEEAEAFGGRIIQKNQELKVLQEKEGYLYYKICPEIASLQEAEQDTEDAKEEMITETAFFSKNYELDIEGNNLFVKSFDIVTGTYLVGLHVEDGVEYYLCDSNFNIIKNDLTGFKDMREYPEGLLVFEQSTDTCKPWYLVNLSAEKLKLRSIWEDKVIETEFPLEETAYLEIESRAGNGNPLCIHGEWNDRQGSVFLIDYELADVVDNGRFSLEVSDSQVAYVTEKKGKSATETLKKFYVREDGEWIAGGDNELFYWINSIFYIRKNEEGLFVQSKNGSINVEIIR